MPTLAVAALSARAMAEAAAQDGFDVVALDLFGDADTRRAASRWVAIGEPGSLRIDAARVLAALRELAREPEVMGWVAGSGFEGMPDLLEQGAAVLPLIGTAADAVRRLRDPALFFGFLAARGIPYPQVSFEPPEAPDGWLMKDAHGCGGWHVRRLSPSPSGGRRGWGPADACISTTFIERRMAPIPTFPQRGKEQSQACYYQREMPGQPMSATFIGNGRDVRVMGFNEQLTARSGTRHFVFRGVIGPVPVSPEMSDRLTAIAQALTAEFDLRGLCSLDFMRDGDAIGILEVNPRPPASLSLYAPGLMRAHLRACLDASLPPVVTPARPIKGMEIIFAPRPLRLDAAAARRLAAWPGIHDLPEAGQYFNTGDPLCTLSADGDDAEQVHTRLDDGRERLLQSLETLE